VLPRRKQKKYNASRDFFLIFVQLLIEIKEKAEFCFMISVTLSFFPLMTDPQSTCGHNGDETAVSVTQAIVDITVRHWRD
jgi:hypothetical protein